MNSPNTSTKVTRQLDSFTQLSNSLVCKVRVVVGEGDSHEVHIEAPERILPLVETEVRQGTLHLRHTGSFNLRNEAFRVEVRVPSLTWASTTGTGGLSMTGVHGDTFELTNSGVGGVDVDGTAHEFRVMSSATGQTKLSGLRDVGLLVVDLQGVGGMRIEGSARKARLTSSATGKMDLSGLTVHRADIDLSGIGSAKLHVTEKLRGKISGIGSVSVTGSPLMEVQNSGIGSLRVR